MPWGWIAAVVLALVIGTLFGQRLMLARQRWRELRSGFDRAANRDSLEQVFAASLRQREAFDAAGKLEHVRVINAVQFVIVWNWDLNTLLDGLAANREAWSIERGWNRKLYARTLALTIFEALAKLEKLFDPSWNDPWSLRRALVTLGVDARLAPDLDAAHTRISSVLKAHQKLLKGVRNNIVGHRDKDVANQLLWMRKADVKEIEELGVDVLRLTNELLTVLTRVMAELRGIAL